MGSATKCMLMQKMCEVDVFQKMVKTDIAKKIGPATKKITRPANKSTILFRPSHKKRSVLKVNEVITITVTSFVYRVARPDCNSLNLELLSSPKKSGRPIG